MDPNKRIKTSLDNIRRMARSGSKWTQSQLKEYNIKIKDVDEVSFFGQNIEDVTLEELPDSILVNETSVQVDGNDPGYDFLRYHDIIISDKQEITVDMLASEIFRIMRYKGNKRIIILHQRIPLDMCGERTIAETDVCIQNEHSILLLLQEDKAYLNDDDAESQLVAEAIAAFQYNNNLRSRVLRKNELEKYTFPCITMVGSYAKFYKITISQELSEGVINGYKPEHTTTVECYDPFLGNPIKTIGMVKLDDRRKILQCFKLMKEIMLREAMSLN